MRIGMDCRRIAHPERGNVSGIGQYVHHLVRALADAAPHDELVLFFDDHAAAAAKAELVRGRENVTARVLPFSRLARLPLLRSHAVAGAFFSREKLDVLHGPANILPLTYRGASVVTIHDLAPYDHPEWFPAPFPGADTFSRRVVVPGSIERAARVIAVSHATRQDIVRIFDADGSKIDVVHEAAAISAPAAVTAEADRILREHGLHEGKYVLALSVIEPRKNLERLVWAFTRAAKAGRIPADVTLVIAGPDGWMNDSVHDAAAASAITLGHSRIRFLGRVPEGDKAALIAGAAAFAYPSLYEGFGLPPLEAMSLGVPTVVGAAGALPEVCGEGVLLVDPEDTDGIAEALAEVFADPIAAAQLAERGRKRAAEFTWERVARETLAVYEGAVSG